jgi:alpha-1,3-glucan synthase
MTFVGSLTYHANNLDPSDIAALDENPVAAKDIQVDKDLEAQRPENKRQAQEWAGIGQDPNSNLCVFVGRWSKQKGNSLSFHNRYTVCADLF